MGVSRDEIRLALHAIAKTELGFDGDLPDSPLAEVLDSVQRLTLVVALEDHFRICLEPEDEEGVDTLEEVVQMIEKKLNPETSD